MKTLYLDCAMGAAGDMLTAALYELLDENEKKEFLEQINALGLCGVTVSAEKVSKCNISGTHISVTVGGTEETEHDLVHGCDHNHNGMDEIEHIIEELPLSQTVRRNVAEVYKIIADAESNVHGVPVCDIHFHEVGALDAIVDVASVCVLMEKLGITKVISSPVHVGAGQVRCAHGILPVPAPATAYILRDVPVYGGEIRGELCTPTGAALLKYFVNQFGQMPVMKVAKIGYGMGKKDFERANCVRAMLATQSGDSDEVSELVCNIDDMTPEKIGFATERLFEAGALDVYTVPIGMKKSRPGTMLCVMCKESFKDEILKTIFKHTTTLGVREDICRRYTLGRRVENLQTSLGDVRVKYSCGYGAERKKYEYDDISRIAKERGISLDEVEAMLERETK